MKTQFSKSIRKFLYFFILKYFGIRSFKAYFVEFQIFIEKAWDSFKLLHFFFEHCILNINLECLTNIHSMCLQTFLPTIPPLNLLESTKPNQPSPRFELIGAHQNDNVGIVKQKPMQLLQKIQIYHFLCLTGSSLIV